MKRPKYSIKEWAYGLIFYPVAIMLILLAYVADVIRELLIEAEEQPFACGCALGMTCGFVLAYLAMQGAPVWLW